MKNLIAFLLLHLSLLTAAQDGADRITISNFIMSRDSVFIDSAKSLLASGRYNQFVSDEKEMYSKAGKVNRFAVINDILNNLSKNGSEDVSKCFYPRHSVNFYKGNKLVKYVLICFECQGLRFSDERWVTKVKSEKKRMDLMDELKVRFISEGF